MKAPRDKLIAIFEEKKYNKFVSALHFVQFLDHQTLDPGPHLPERLDPDTN